MRLLIITKRESEASALSHQMRDYEDVMVIAPGYAIGARRFDVIIDLWEPGQFASENARIENWRSHAMTWLRPGGRLIQAPGEIVVSDRG